ncbi:MAG: heme-binding domain-containing protein [Chitinophagales bacterium]
MRRKIILFILLILIVIQFFQPKKNQSTELLAADITKVTNVPDEVLNILKTSCYDCHSNNTVYPWYNNIQPIAWWLNNHIKEGKERLNFSEFGKYNMDKSRKKLRGIIRDIEEGEMPLSSYTLIHRNAILDEAQKKLVTDWAKNAVIKTVD